MRHVPYVGNGPYCYANSFAMVMGERAPSTALIEVTTCGPFGMQLIAGCSSTRTAGILISVSAGP